MKNFSRLLATCLVALGSTAIAHSGADHGKATAAHEGHSSALGQPGVLKKVSRTVEITMSDNMRYIPTSVAVKRNETIRFVLKNEGELKHEMVLGTIKELQAHAALMLKFPEMEHADPNQASVEPGKTGEMVWQFTKAGTFDFACLQAGHYEAGMKGEVVVAGVSTAPGAPGSTLPLAAAAQGETPPASQAVSVAPQASAIETTEGEIRKVDKVTKKITIKHGEIKNLDMPGMTMLFQVKDPAMLDAVKPGDKVRFKAEKTGGAIVVTDIEVTK